MIEEEQGVLGCALLGAADDCIAEGVTTDYFAHEDHRRIWDAIHHLKDTQQPCNTLTVLNQVNKGDLKNIGPDILTTCEDSAPTSSNLGYWLPTLRKNALRRIYRAKITRLSTVLDDESLEPNELSAAFESEILDANVDGTNSCTRKEDMQRLMARIEDVQYKGKILGYDTGFDDLDKHLYGLEKGKIYVIAGRPGAGKTAIAQCIAANLVKKGVETLIYSCEMTVDQLNLRMLAAESGVNSRDFLQPKRLTANQFKPIANSAADMIRWPIYIKDDSDLTISQIRADARRMKRFHGIKVIIVDYLQLLEPDRHGEKRHEAVGRISGGLKNMAKELDVPVVALAQLNRETEKGSSNRAPRASDLRESGKIEADADAVLALWEPDPDNRPAIDHSIIECVICKNRHGSTGTIRLLFKKDTTTFETLSPIDDTDIPI